MEDRDGQHMGVVTKALVKDVPPSSMILRVLFITCREPRGQVWRSVLSALVSLKWAIDFVNTFLCG